MRLPSDVLDRVRGALVVAALASCNHEVTAPAPSATPVAPAAGVAPPPEPVDPVRYASADEAERLARLDAEDTASVEARHVRLGRLAALHREQQGQEGLRPVFGIGPGPQPRGLMDLGNRISPFTCYACGRG